MKFYESHYEEYIESMNKYNLHPELSDMFNSLPKKCSDMSNLILYGPSGAGKYTQSLAILKRYSASELKYDKKITIQTDKHDYMYHISDIHYEIDMSMLGCNSKILWRELFSQIVDIISVKNDKYGFILCKNFHNIHSELLDVFYSYIQQYSHYKSTIKIHFILLTEHISFIPNNIIQACQLINISRPTKLQYKNIYVPAINEPTGAILDNFSKKIGAGYDMSESNNMNIIKQIKSNEILNCKELKSLSSISNGKIPKDIFNVVCDNIINEMTSPSKLSYITFRDAIYDMLVYNLDVAECIWYILYFFIKNRSIKDCDLSDVLDRCYVFLKYYNNNYRPIYHLESILFYFIIKIRRYEC